MTKLIDYIQETVVGKVATRIPTNMFALLDVYTRAFPDDIQDAIRYRLHMTISTEVVCRTHEEKVIAKERLIEQLKYYLYNDLLEIIYKLESAIYNYDNSKAIEVLQELRNEVLR